MSTAYPDPLTRLLISAAIATPRSGWLASRHGRNAIMTASIAGFIAVSALCAAANDLPTIVAALIPLILFLKAPGLHTRREPTPPVE